MCYSKGGHFAAKALLFCCLWEDDAGRFRNLLCCLERVHETNPQWGVGHGRWGGCAGYSKGLWASYRQYWWVMQRTIIERLIRAVSCPVHPCPYHALHPTGSQTSCGITWGRHFQYHNGRKRCEGSFIKWAQKLWYKWTVHEAMWPWWSGWLDIGRLVLVFGHKAICTGYDSLLLM